MTTPIQNKRSSSASATTKRNLDALPLPLLSRDLL